MVQPSYTIQATYYTHSTTILHDTGHLLHTQYNHPIQYRPLMYVCICSLVDLYIHSSLSYICVYIYIQCHVYHCTGIVRGNGSIVKCFDEMCGDFLVSDELKKVTEFLG